MNRREASGQSPDVLEPIDEFIHQAIVAHRDEGEDGTSAFWDYCRDRQVRLLRQVDHAMGIDWRWKLKPRDRFFRFIAACADGVPLTRRPDPRAPRTPEAVGVA